MSYNFVRADDSYLRNDTVGASVKPVTISAWFRQTAVTGIQAGVYCGDPTAVTTRIALGRTGGTLRLMDRGGTAAVNADGGTLPAAGTWYHAAGVYVSATSRTPYLDGVAGTTVTTDCGSQVAYTRTSVGRMDQNSFQDAFDGDIAEVAIWDVSLSADDIAALAAGDSPMSLATEPVRYWRLKDDGGLTDLIASEVLTASAATWSSAHPTVDDPPSGIVAGAIASAFTGSTIAPTIPAHVTGDPIIVVASKNDASTLSLSGWTAIGTPENDANLSSGAWYKIAASAAETASVASSTAATSTAGLYAQAFVADGTAYDAVEAGTWAGTPTNSTTPAGSTITTTVDDSTALAVALLDAQGGYASGLPPTGWTTLSDLSAQTGGGAVNNHIDPSGDGANNAWTKSTGTSASDLLDDGVREPTAPTTGSDQITSGTAGQLSDLILPNTLTYTSGDTYTVWVYSSSGAKRGLSTLIAVDDATFANAEALHVAGQAFAWRSRDISSLITSQGTLDGLRVQLRCDSTAGGGGAGVVTVAAVYVTQGTTAPITAGGRITSITKDQPTAGSVTGATIGTLTDAAYWKTLTLGVRAPSVGPATHFGATASTYTFGATTAGFATKAGASASTYTLGAVVAGFATKSGASSSTWTLGATTAGARTVFGASATTITFGATTAGFATKAGATASTITFSATTAGAKTTFGASATTITFGATTAGSVGGLPDRMPESTGTTVYVATTGDDTTGDGSIGNPWLTITKGILGLTSGVGGIVYVRTGTYSSTVENWNRPGASTNPVTVAAYNDEAVTITGRTNIYRDYFRVRGITFGYTGTSPSVYALQQAGSPASHIELDQCIIEGGSNHGIFLEGGASESTRCDDFQMHRSIMRDNGDIAASPMEHNFYPKWATNWVVSDCIIHDGAGSCAHIGNSSTGGILANSTLVRPGEQETVVIWSEATGTRTSDTLVVNCIITTDLVDEDTVNTTWGGGSAGTNNVIRNCVVFGASGTGVNVDTSAGGLTEGASVVKTDPLFVDDPGNDWRVLDGSPAIGIADPAYESATDFNGETRSDGIVGAFGVAVTVHAGASASTYTFNSTTAGFATKFGASATTITFGATTAGVRTRFGATASTYTLGATTAGFATKAGASASTYTLGAVVAGFATKTGATTSTYTFGATTAATRTTFGASATTVVFGATTTGFATKAGASATTITFSATTAGAKTTFGASATTITFGAVTAGSVTSGATEHFGATASTYTFGATVAGFATKTGASASTFAFGATTAGFATKTGASASTWTFGATTAGVRTRFGVSALPIVFGAVTAGDVSSGPVTHFGATASTWTLSATTAGFATKTGATASTYTFGATTTGARVVSGSSSLSITLGATTAGVRTRFGATSMPITLGATTAGTKTTFGSTSLPVTFGATTTAVLTAFGVVSMPLVLTSTTNGVRVRFGTTDLPITFSADVTGGLGIPQIPANVAGSSSPRRAASGSSSPRAAVTGSSRGLTTVVGAVSIPED